MTIWDVITSNSSLLVGAGNTFFDHLNNQVGGGGVVHAGPVLSADAVNDLLEANIDQSVTTDLLSNTLSADVSGSNSADVIQTSLEANLCSQ
jgi:hypothetical protein